MFSQCQECGCREAIAGSRCPNCEEVVEVIHSHKGSKVRETKMKLVVEGDITHWIQRYPPRKRGKLWVK